MKLKYFSAILFLSALLGCREVELIDKPIRTPVSIPEFTDLAGFYLLNEGNMGSNTSTLDYYDYTTGVYSRNIYPEANPTVVKELGDVGNDLQIYGSKLYAVINCSHKVEVMDVASVKRIRHIDIPNCRYIAFHEGYAYVSSYIGPVQINPQAPLGAVFKVDTTSLEVVGSVEVGYQPEEMVVRFGKLYVANSGGYRAPNYDNRVSVINLNTFTLEKQIEVAVNLHRMEGDRHGNIYVSSRGNMYEIPSAMYVIDAYTDQVTARIDVEVSDFCIAGDSAYVSGAPWSYETGENTISYAIVDLNERRVVNRNFITDGTDRKIKLPYGIAVNPITKDIYITDAKNYLIPGTLYCFGQNGVKKWQATTGNIPAHIAFYGKTTDKIYENEEQPY